ncbi:hypothetical protein [Streptomyces sp. NPDC002825]|uniref:hypothetical protein n=1 Tax=Streptomyces sp. NPDC002825 TaxID=3154666 RepID=UPI00332BA6A6
MSVVLGRGVGPQFLDPMVSREQVGQLVVIVDGGDVLPGVQQGDRFVDAALTFADRGKQPDRRVGFEASAAPWAVAPVLVRNPGGQQRGDVCVPVCSLGDVDQGGGKEPVLHPGAQPTDRLVRTSVPGKQPREELERKPSDLRVRPGQRDRLLGPPPALQ